MLKKRINYTPAVLRHNKSLILPHLMFLLHILCPYSQISNFHMGMGKVYESYITILCKDQASENILWFMHLPFQSRNTNPSGIYEKSHESILKLAIKAFILGIQRNILFLYNFLLYFIKLPETEGFSSRDQDWIFEIMIWQFLYIHYHFYGLSSGSSWIVIPFKLIW